MATSIFSIIEDLTVDLDDITEAELFCEKYLSSQFPTYDFRQGTAIRDMTVRPNATLLALVNKAIKYYFDESDVINMTNDTDNELVDRKLSNLFLTRKSGENATIKVRMYFSFPTNDPTSIIVPVSAFFSADNEYKFYPSDNIAIYPPSEAEEPGKYYFRYDGSSDLWYVDVDLVSEGDSEYYNLESGDLLYFTIFSPYFLKAEIQYLVSAAISEETNEDFVGRASTSISTRNLINTPSIEAHIGANYNYVGDVYAVGLGNDWMQRDIVKIADVSDPDTIHEYHRGGHTDVYLETAPIVQTAQLTVEEDREIPGEVACYLAGPVFDISRALTAAETDDSDTIPYWLSPLDPELGVVPFTFEQVDATTYDSDSIPANPEKDKGLSAKQITKIKWIDNMAIGTTASFDFVVFSGVGSVDDGLNNTANSIVCADYLARSFEPVFVDIEVVLRDDRELDEDVAFENVNAYIAKIPNGGSIYMSEIVSSLIEGGVKDFQMPLTVTLNRYPKDVYGNEDGAQNIEVETLVDNKDLLDIRKFYLRDITYNEAT